MTYKPDPRGLAEIGRSPGLQAAVLAAAGRGAAAARSANPEGIYEVRPQDLAAGRRDERRVGAVVENTHPEAYDQETRTRALQRSVAAIEGGL